jgi:acyl carrier protein
MRPGFELRDEDSLLRKGVMDSLGVMEVVGFVEEHWDITVDPSEITEDRFGSIASLAQFVAERTGVETSAG